MIILAPDRQWSIYTISTVPLSHNATNIEENMSCNKSLHLIRLPPLTSRRTESNDCGPYFHVYEHKASLWRKVKALDWWHLVAFTSCKQRKKRLICIACINSVSENVMLHQVLRSCIHTVVTDKHSHNICFVPLTNAIIAWGVWQHRNL